MLAQRVRAQLQRPKVCRNGSLLAPSSRLHLFHRVQNLSSNPLKYQPAVNQVELSFWNPQPEFLKVGFATYMHRSRTVT